MKKLFTLLALVGFLMPTCFSRAEDQGEKSEVAKQKASFFMKTPPLRDLLEKIEPPEDDFYDNWVSKDRRHPLLDWNEISDHGIPENNGIDPILQTEDGWRDGSNTLKENWQGQGGALPPDPTGAAGMNYYVQAVNSTYRIYNKDGNPETFSLPLSILWPGSGSDGDPIVMYDRYADRWFISQFQTDGSNQILIAISETSDPLGAYYLYAWTFSSFPDYPKYGVWHNAYYMTANTGSTDCVMYERDKMLSGDPTASMIALHFPNIGTGGGFFSIAPAYAEGVWAPDADEPGWAFAVQDNSWTGVSFDHIEVFKIRTDWVTPSNSNVVSHQDITTSAFNTVFTSSWNDLAQPGTSQKLDAVPKIFMYRAQYRRFEGYDVMILVHTVDVNGANRAGVRWYELRKDDGSDQWYLYQESTFDPNDGNSRWMGNAAMDLNGNIGMAYSIVGPSEFAGIRYTGRFADDPLNTMTIQEQEAIEGAGAQTISNRFGDYSQMTVDPFDDATFWFTGEYLGPSGSRRTRIFSFAMWELLGEEEKPVSNPHFNAYQPNPSELTIIWKDLKDDQFDITVVDMKGKLIARKNNMDATMGQKVFDIPRSATGIYIVSLLGKNTQLSDKVYLSR